MKKNIFLFQLISMDHAIALGRAAGEFESGAVLIKTPPVKNRGGRPARDNHREAALSIRKINGGPATPPDAKRPCGRRLVPQAAGTAWLRQGRQHIRKRRPHGDAANSAENSDGRKAVSRNNGAPQPPCPHAVSGTGTANGPGRPPENSSHARGKKKCRMKRKESASSAVDLRGERR